jgi:transcriptional regulator with XRE-family HTH domain
VIFVYNSQSTAQRIKEQAKLQNKQIKNMLSECGLGINALSQFAKGQHLSSFSLAKIADYLNCSVDYLLGRTNNPDMSSRLPELTKEEWDKIELFAQGLIASRK